MRASLLILHGWGSSSGQWREISETLRKRGYDVYVPDLPGFGNNPSPSKPWSIDNYVEWVREYCEKQNLLRFFLLGHSFGGGVAVKFANYFPGKINGLMLVAPALRREKGVKYYLILSLAKLGKVIFLIPGLSFLYPLACRAFYFVVGSKDYAKINRQKAVIMRETFKKVVNEDLRPYLPSINKKTLIIWGTKDKFTPFKDARATKEQIKNSQLEIIDGAGHALNLKAPALLSQKIIKFLDICGF